jgi:hypothetical protein
MISSEVQRTLVKSPPELWAELSDPAALSRHLGELGEIRITRVDPEQAVEWEAGEISGTVLIKPSGWGTKVTLTVNGELDQQAEPALDATEPEPAPEPWPASAQAEPEPTEEAWPDPIEDETEATLAASPQAEPDAAADRSWQEPAAALEVPHQREAASGSDQFEPEPEPVTRRGWLSRLFGRRPKTELVDHQPAEALEILEQQAEPPEAASSEQALEPSTAGVTVESPPATPEPPQPAQPPRAPMLEPIEASISSAPVDPAEAEPADVATELRADEQVTAQHVVAVLTAVLDRLGAAHHRPFSRG